MLLFELHISLLEMEHLLLECFYLQRRALLDLLQSVFEVVDCGLVLLLLCHQYLEVVCCFSHLCLAHDVRGVVASHSRGVANYV